MVSGVLHDNLAHYFACREVFHSMGLVFGPAAGTFDRGYSECYLDFWGYEPGDGLNLRDGINLKDDPNLGCFVPLLAPYRSRSLSSLSSFDYSFPNSTPALSSPTNPATSPTSDSSSSSSDSSSATLRPSPHSPTSFSHSDSSSSSSGSTSATIPPTPLGYLQARYQELDSCAQEVYEKIVEVFLKSVAIHGDMAWPLNGTSSLAEDTIAARLKDTKIDDLLQTSALPIASVVGLHVPARSGVMMISNIPYTVTRPEIAAFLGRSARTLPPSQGSPIHIIMERSTGKTMDCFVELETEKDAKDTVDRINNRSYDLGSSPRIGNRHVDVELSSPAKMMKAIFPLAKCIAWVEGKPVRLENKDSWSTGFDGFLTDEELFCLLRHAEQPHRSAFASKVPQRCYESFITTILKFPWHAPNLYTVYHRNKLFLTMKAMIQTLVGRIKNKNTVGLDLRLLQELVQTGIGCPGFNPRMKWSFAHLSKEQPIIDSLDQGYCLYFPFDTLNYVPGHTSLDVQYYAFIMSHGCASIPNADGLMNQHGHPDILRVYGMNFFEWNEEVAKRMIFTDANIYEARLFREFLITGFQRMRGRQTSTSTIGTAPSTPPSPDDDDASSERTVVNVFHPARGNRVLPVTPTREDTRATSYPDFARNWTFPMGPSVRFEHTDSTDTVVPETPTRLPATERIQPYRPPHARNAASGGNARNQRGYQRRRDELSSGSAMNMPPPTYYAPHATAQSVRSSSDPDPFGGARPMALISHRSNSDAHRANSHVRSSIFSRIQGSRGSGAGRK